MYKYLQVESGLFFFWVGTYFFGWKKREIRAKMGYLEVIIMEDDPAMYQLTRRFDFMVA